MSNFLHYVYAWLNTGRGINILAVLKVSHCKPILVNHARLWYICRSTLTRVMMCCPKAPSHYLNQCWLTISEVLRHLFDVIFTEVWKIINLILQPDFPGANELKCIASNRMWSFDSTFWLIFPWCRLYASVNQVSIGSDNGLSPIRRQAFVWTSAGLLSIGPLGTNFS